MSFSNPANTITRWSVVGMEGMWAKMFDPPTTSPATTDQLALVQQGLIRPNPVPEVLFAAGLRDEPEEPHLAEFDLLHGLKVETWDGAKELEFMLIGDPSSDAAKGGTYPGATLRMPRGVIFNAEVQGKGPPPHTIHWHGIEPTPINDGVGHCSMELGRYTYQWQPNFMGFYFAHCHRNTMQHFEFGLYMAMIFEAPDAYFGSIASTRPNGSVVLRDLNQFPIGGGRDGKRRVACNLDDPLTGLPRFTQFPGFNRRPIDSPDDQPLGPNDTNIRFPTDPHAMTVTFDVESLLVFDDRDSVWSDLGDDARATFPRQGSQPGINDHFRENPGRNGFAAFNDFNADYWFVTGVPVPASRGGVGTIPANVVIPAALNSGISGTQVSINAQTGQTILVRCLVAAYNCMRLTFPVDIVVIAWDGRALGVAPYGHNESYLVPAGEPFDITVARRFDALIRETNPLPANSFIKAEFIDHTSQTPGDDTERVVMTCRVPINIGGPVIDPPTFAFIGKAVNELGQPVQGVAVTATSLTLGGSAPQTAVTAANGEYTINGILNGTYEIVPSKSGKIFKTPNQVVTCNNQNLQVADIVVSIADFEAPGGYTLPDALKSLRDVVGLDTPSDFEKFRYDVAPFLDGVPAPDNVLDIRDSLNILRMVVGLPPR